jgi:hypothetical protein
MHDLLKAISDWPVIVQGALGSALFWLISLMGRKSVSLFLDWYSPRSRKLKIRLLISRLFKYQALLGKSYHDDSAISSILIYRAFRYVVKGLIWLTLGIYIGFPILSEVGYIGCFIYLLFALEILTPIEKNMSDEEVQHEIKKLKAKLSEFPELKNYQSELKE